jgi:uncharacterized protein YigA (DUF484 family)
MARQRMPVRFHSGRAYFNVGVVSANNSLVGSSANDQVGSGGVTTVGTTAFVVRSPLWDNGAATDAGAVSFGSTTFINVGVVSANNSLVGSSANDQVGSGGVTTVGTTTYVIRSPLWDNGAATDAGAVSFGSTTFINVGVVSANNSLVGSSANDQVGSVAINMIGTAAFVVRSPLWDNGSATDAGAVTFGTSSYGFGVGQVSTTNSLVGSSANDQVGSGGINTIGTAAFVVRSPFWDNGAATDAGAVTFGTSSYGFGIGPVSAANSLVGSSANDQVGSVAINTIGTTAFVVRSPLWDNGAATDAGAVTFGTSSYGFGVGLVSTANSLVGSHPNDQIGSGGITLQGTTAYIVSSPNWCYGASATTTASSTFGIVGVVSSANSVTGVENALPQISIEQPVMTIISNGGNRNFGEVIIGSFESLIFSIKNTGTDDLLITGVPRVVVTGADAQQFTVTVQPPPMIVTGGSATVVVRFQPTSIGVKSALISISNNVSNQRSFQINLSGMGSIPISAWRQTFLAVRRIAVMAMT